jgi:hypothetical protein
VKRMGIRQAIYTKKRVVNWHLRCVDVCSFASSKGKNAARI